MTVVDIVGLVALLIFAIIGLIVGFGKGLKFFTSGIFGFIISIFVTYILFGLVKSLAFVQTLMSELMTWLNSITQNNATLNNIFVEVLPTADIVLVIVLFILIQLLRKLLVFIIKSLFEINNGFIKFLNKLLGMVLFIGIIVALAMVFFQLIPYLADIFPDSMSKLENAITQSSFVSWLYENNPLKSIFESVQF